MSQELLSMGQCLQRRILFSGGSREQQSHQRMAKVRRKMDFNDAGGADPRIGHFVANQLFEFFPNDFRHAFSAKRVLLQRYLRTPGVAHNPAMPFRQGPVKFTGNRALANAGAPEAICKSACRNMGTGICCECPPDVAARLLSLRPMARRRGSTKGPATRSQNMSNNETDNRPSVAIKRRRPRGHTATVWRTHRRVGDRNLRRWIPDREVETT